MKSSNIAESVYNVNLKYVELQNKTKELFFKCLEENRDTDYFNQELAKLWGEVDHSFLKDEINSYIEAIHDQNMTLFGAKSEPEDKEFKEYLKLVPIAVILGAEAKFVKKKEIEYNNSTRSYFYKTNKEEYLKMKVQKYTDQVVPYYSQTTGKKVRDVELSTYASMIHNTNLTRTTWNTTLNDAVEIGQTKFYIPYHSFSCPYCIAHQNKVMTAKQVMKLIGHIEEQEGDILHPNCKCILTFYNGRSKFNKPKYSKAELEEQYNIRQKTNSLTLKKEKIKTDMKIQKSLGNQDEVDELNKERNLINKEIRKLKEALPTTELKKQVVAINR